MSMYSNCYDYYFKSYTDHFFKGRLDWHWVKAIAIAESELNPEAVSSCGAIGVMQLMPATSSWMAERIGIVNDPEIPDVNIMFGIGYLKHCYDIWRKERDIERLRFAFGSYNAGPGHILSAQDKAGAAGLPTDKWSSIVAKLHFVTGHANSRQTIEYVSRIEEIYHRLAERTS